ncbi:MAG: hypothetical protein ACYC11_10025 [Bellilinea sp.]
MKNHLKIKLGIFVIALAMLSCNLPKGAAVPKTTSLESPTPIAVSVDPSTGQAYSPARLQVDDLPDGFRELTEQELQDLGLSSSQFTSAFAGMLTNAKPENFAAFISTSGSFEVVVSMLMAPLTSLEGAAIDLYLRDPLRFADDFAAAAGASDLMLDEGALPVGDSSSSVTFSLPDYPLDLNGGITASRNEKVLQIALLFYPDGSKPVLTSSDVAAIVDAKLTGLE